MYRTEIIVNSTDINSLINDYCQREKFLEFCKECKAYNAVWSCPPLSFDPVEYLQSYKKTLVIGVKIIYADELRSGDNEYANEKAKEIMAAVKGRIHTTQLAAEKESEGIMAISSGSCNICTPCERVLDKPCKYPEKMRHSFDSFGIDLTKVAENLLETKLLWANNSLPEYHMLISAFLLKNGCELEADEVKLRFEAALNK